MASNVVSRMCTVRFCARSSLKPFSRALFKIEFIHVHGTRKLNGISTYNLALRQLEDYDLGRPGTLFAGGIELSVDQAYALQTAVVHLRCKRGEKVIGYKVGCTSPAIRSQLGIDHCIMGRLFDTEQHPSGTSVSGNAYAGLACEGELAIELSRPPNPRDFQTKGLPDCVSRVFPVIELHQYVIRSQKTRCS